MREQQSSSSLDDLYYDSFIGQPLRVDKNTIKLCKGEWSTTENLLAVRAKNEWEIQKLYLWENSRPQILQDILHIYFRNLQFLNVDDNQITSIESLCRLNMPRLQHFRMAGNKIRDGKTLRKLHCPELVSIRIGVESAFCDVERLSEAEFPLLQSFSVCCDSKKITLFWFCLLLKLQTQHLISLESVNMFEEMQLFTKEKLSRRWPNLQYEHY